MLLQAQPILMRWRPLKPKPGSVPQGAVILLDPAGRRFDQAYARELPKKST